MMEQYATSSSKKIHSHRRRSTRFSVRPAVDNISMMDEEYDGYMGQEKSTAETIRDLKPSLLSHKKMSFSSAEKKGERRRSARFIRRESEKNEDEDGDTSSKLDSGIDISFPNKYASMCSEPGLVSLSYQAINSQADTRSQMHTDIESHFKPAPFAMRWIHGYNQKVPVINLNYRGNTTLFYAAVNCGVLYNWTSNTMKILEGHRHMVTCLASDADGNWLVTADSGPENIITIWDTLSYYPNRTLFAPHGNMKVSKLALSADAKYLLTLGYHEKAVIHWWIWSYGQDTPHAVTEVDIPQYSVVAVGFHPERSEDFFLMTKQDIWIGTVTKTVPDERGLIKDDEYKLKIRKPEKDIGPEFGKLTCFCFVPDTSQIFVGTSRGAVLVYGYSLNFQEFATQTDIEDMKFVKALMLEKYRINVIKSVDGVIVTGNHGGEIRFYDEHLMLLYWVHGFRPDSVKGLSFNPSPRSYQVVDSKCNTSCACWDNVKADTDPFSGEEKQKLKPMNLPADCTTEHRPFLVRDFVVSTQNQGIGFVDFVKEKMEIIVNCKVTHATAMSVNPDLSIVCMGYADGVVELFSYAEHRVLTRVDLRQYYKVVIPPNEHSINCTTNVVIPELAVTCLKYSPSGLHLACGLNTGELIFLEPTMIGILSKEPHKDVSHSIKEIAFSPDSMTMAMADTGRTVCVYKHDCRLFTWRFIGKHRSHYKDICSIFFSPQKKENGEYKLFSIGADRILVEYDIALSFDEYLEIYSLDRIDQTAVPLAGIVWPNMKGLDPEQYRNDIPMILVANDEYKYKIVNDETTMTLLTTLGPRYESPVCKMQLITKKESDDEEHQYLLFATKNVIGLQKMPLDGNPWKHVGILGHPIQLTEMCFREDSSTLFTIGAKDSCMIQWAAKHKSVEWTTAIGGSNLDPYYFLVEDGRSGWLFQEIRDLFYYVQILCQGTFSPAVRRVRDYVPIEALPDLMRAVGYFPTEYEVENLIVEAKYKVYQRNVSKEVNFEEFVKLYLNHRPAFGDSYTKLRNAFRRFAVFQDGRYSMNREDFLDTLNNYGECFSREMSWYLLSILSGMTAEDRAVTANYDFSFLPGDISFQEFVNDIIGIYEMDTSDGHSMMGSMGSQQTGSSNTDQSGSDRYKNN